MKTRRILLLLVVCLSSPSLRAAEPARTIADIKAIPKGVMERTISSTIYRELLVSPIQAWVSVRGQLSGTHIYGARVIHSEDNGVYDKYALQLAKDWQISGHLSVDKISPTSAVVLDVLIYQIADGTMAVSFPYFDEPGGEQLEYYGSAKLAIEQPDGRWRDLALPGRPKASGEHAEVFGQAWAVRAGLRNSFEAEMKMQQLGHP